MPQIHFLKEDGKKTEDKWERKESTIVDYNESVKLYYL